MKFPSYQTLLTSFAMMVSNVAVLTNAEDFPLITPSFGVASLKGAYAYSNRLSDVGSYGIMEFDGKGSVTMDDLRVNRPLSATMTREIVSIGPATGNYTIEADGSGKVFLDFATQPEPLGYEFVVVESGKVSIGVKVAKEVDAFLTTPGLDGQLVAPTFSKI
jgi:hypothetical protein